MRFLVSSILVVLALALTACESEKAEAPPPQIAAPTYPRLVFIAPPPPLPETVPESPDPRKEVWRPGYWAYDNGNFTWVPGHMMPRPAPWAVWSPDQWVQHTYGWGFEPGTWQ